MTFKSRVFIYLFFILSGFLHTQTACAYSAPNVWDVLRRQFALNHEVTQPEVQNQLRWLISHPSYLHKLAQSEPYMYHILTEIKKRNMPGEIALIPMIESSYDPFAYSGAGAAGLWQFMPGTGTDLGLKQDWWFDARRSIGPSTDAALNYLLYLHNFFNGNWILAFAAYDSGEGTMARIIKNSKQNINHVHFWTLAVPSETKAYIPRLLALAEIIQNPQRYHIELPNIPHAPYFEEVNIGSQIDLDNAAKLAGISYRDLLRLNPGYNRWATAPYRPYKLLIPANKVENFSRNLANLPEDQRVSWTRHQVSAGDNLQVIAQKYHTTANLIKELNQLKSNAVQKGQVVMIPSQNTKIAIRQTNTAPARKVLHFTAPQDYKLVHIVGRRDTYQSIQNKYSVSARQLRQWNKLSTLSKLHPGQSLVIYRKVRQPIQYVIRSGDSLSVIAQRNHTSVSGIMRLNPRLAQNKLKPGQSIRIS
ncbi:MAG: LysM peptidoglycan-binding domain-containing protein [Legionellaceae bacterium]|nr:LysM peptidoglycan-binding domain-containing protein [Legionellaceae bacterium]